MSSASLSPDQQPAAQAVAQDMARLVLFHGAHHEADLRAVLERELHALLPLQEVAVLHYCEEQEVYQVVLTLGVGCPLEEGALVQPEDWQPDPCVVLPLHCDGHVFGQVLARGEVEPATLMRLQATLLHYSTAVANLCRREESLRSVDYLCSSLRAFEDGVVLFQLQDRKVAAARFLQLGLTLVGAEAGALLLIEDFDDEEALPVLSHCLGMPESVVAEMCLDDEDKTWWPGVLAGGAATVLRRSERDQLIPLLDNASLPPVLDSVFGTPLSYHGVVVGACVFLNVEDTEELAGRRSSIQHLFELGAAIFHRLHMEEQALRSEQLSTQLQIAEDIQSRLLPQRRPSSRHLDMHWSSVMSKAVGGDYIDVLEGPEGDVFATVADVSGHGVDSALLMSSYRAAYRSRVQEHSPDALLTRLNEGVKSEVGETGMFLTTLSLHLAADLQTLRLANAGHNPAFVYRAGTDEVQQIQSSGPPLGVFPRVRFETDQLQLRTGDVLLVYTDGVVEATRRGGEEMFGEQRLEALLRRHAADGAERLVAAVEAALQDFSGLDNQMDDVSLLVLRLC